MVRSKRALSGCSLSRTSQRWPAGVPLLMFSNALKECVFSSSFEGSSRKRKLGFFFKMKHLKLNLFQKIVRTRFIYVLPWPKTWRYSRLYFLCIFFFNFMNSHTRAPKLNLLTATCLKCTEQEVWKQYFVVKFSQRKKVPHFL